MTLSPVLHSRPEASGPPDSLSAPASADSRGYHRLTEIAQLALPSDTEGRGSDPLRRALLDCPPAHSLALGRRRRSSLRTHSATDRAADAVERAQAVTTQGPSCDALRRQELVVTADLRTDTRWPLLRAQVPATVRAVLSTPLAAAGHDDWVLTAHSPVVGAFDEDAVIEQVLHAAAEVAVRLTAAAWRANSEHLELALQSSRRIGMAVGVIMCQLHVTEEQAFDALRTLSQEAHRKLRDIAEDVIMTGALPPPTTRRSAGR